VLQLSWPQTSAREPLRKAVEWHRPCAPWAELPSEVEPYGGEAANPPLAGPCRLRHTPATLESGSAAWLRRGRICDGPWRAVSEVLVLHLDVECMLTLPGARPVGSAHAGRSRGDPR
jgi:hypothetical protein